jgi:hypothetical protein
MDARSFPKSTPRVGGELPRSVLGLVLIVICLCLLGAARAVAAQDEPQQFRRLSVADYRQKMRAGWLGQMVGVSLGAPTEFRYRGQIIPEDAVPELYAGIANNAFGQDDLYVEMTFLDTLDTYGLDVSAAQAGIDFANSEYQLWHANLAARNNLRQGIAPPDSGHPHFSGFSDDIDYQIESDFAGLISPGMPNNAIALGNKFGTIMNYGDGLYGGQFVACMYAEAFFEDDPAKLVEYGLSCIPAQSQYAEAIRDVLGWWRENPADWQATWQHVEEKYQLNPAYRRYSSPDEYFTDAAFNIDAKINGAYVVIGLLYGNSDPLQTIVTSMRSGQDSDCNPSSAAGILAAALGYDQLPDEFTQGLDTSATFSYTDYDFERLLAVSEKLARESVLQAGGSIEVDANGEEVFVIPVQTPQPAEFVQSWEPGPISGSLYNNAQMLQIVQGSGLSIALRSFAPGWVVAECSDDPILGLVDEAWDREAVLLTYPVSREVPCRLTRTMTLPADATSTLRLDIGYFPGSDWELVVRANDQNLVEQVIDSETAPDGWLQIEVDLSAYAGQVTRLELLNQANGWSWAGGYWASIEIIHDSP